MACGDEIPLRRDSFRAAAYHHPISTRPAGVNTHADASEAFNATQTAQWQEEFIVVPQSMGRAPPGKEPSGNRIPPEFAYWGLKATWPLLGCCVGSKSRGVSLYLLWSPHLQ